MKRVPCLPLAAASGHFHSSLDLQPSPLSLTDLARLFLEHVELFDTTILANEVRSAALTISTYIHALEPRAMSVGIPQAAASLCKSICKSAPKSKRLLLHSIVRPLRDTYSTYSSASSQVRK